MKTAFCLRQEPLGQKPMLPFSWARQELLKAEDALKQAGNLPVRLQSFEKPFGLQVTNYVVRRRTTLSTIG